MDLLLPAAALFGGLWLLIWSADRFVEGSAITARLLGLSPLLIGMLVVGFGTSAPEMLVSALSAMKGNTGLALGNAYGSNISNLALILGFTAVVLPITVHSQLLKRELPLLTFMTLVSWILLSDGELSRLDGFLMLGLFAASMSWTVWMGVKHPDDKMLKEVQNELPDTEMNQGKALWILISGLLLLVASSRALVWGAVKIAESMGISDLIIGLTVVAVGTSLPELTSTLAAVKKGEDDLAIGNVIGSNMFNTLAVVGIAGSISPLDMSRYPEVLKRDIPLMTVLTLSMFIFGYGIKGKGRIDRLEGGILLGAWCIYTGILVWTALV